jgi:glyoxylase-like metal-dependent hydrolase (beta-lactamase superfamily II)
MGAAVKKLRKILKWLGILAVIAVISALLLARLSRHRFDEVKTMQSGMAQVSNNGSWIYGLKLTRTNLRWSADERGDVLDALLSKLGVTRDQVTDIFLTHAHWDHVALVPLCRKARVHLGIEDVDMAAQKAPQEPRGARWMAILGATPAINITDPLSGRTEFEFGGKKLLAIPLPGHTPGSYIYIWEGVLFTGDSMHSLGDKLGFAMGVFSTDLALNRGSIAKLKDIPEIAGIEQICTGHQGCIPPGDSGPWLDDLIERASSGLN